MSSGEIGSTGLKISGSPFTINESLGIFDVPGTHSSVERGYYSELAPSRLSEYGPIEIEIPGDVDHYIDLSNSYLQIEGKVVKDDGSNLDNTAANVNVVPGDAFFHSLIKTATFKINGSVVEHSSDYPMRSFIETLLNNSREAKQYQLKAEGWFQDDNLAKDGAEFDNSAATARKNLIRGSNSFEFFGRLHLSIFQQERYLIPGLNCKLELDRSKPSYCLMAATATPGGGGKVKLTKCVLHLRKLKINQTIQLLHNEKLLNGVNAKYPLSRVYTRSYNVNTGLTHTQIKIADNTLRPNLILVSLSSHDGENGSYNRNPFKFGHYDVSHVELQIDGLPFGKRYTPNFVNRMYTRPYVQLLNAMGKDLSSEGSGIGLSEYETGLAIYAFDLTGDLSSEGFHLMRHVSLTIDIGFRVATPENVYLNTYIQKDGMMEIASDFSVRLSGGSIF